jgi:peptidylprolyl isomerase
VYVALARRGAPPSAERLAALDLPPPVAQGTRARMLLAAKTAAARSELMAWITPEAIEQGEVHPVVVMAVIDGVKDEEDPAVTPWLRAIVGSAGPFDFDDPYVAATAVSALGERGDVDMALTWCEKGAEAAHVHVEVRQAMQGAMGTLAKDEAIDPELKQRIVRALRGAMTGDASAWVQKAARKALDELGEEVPAETTLQPNDWRGLPRPSGPVLGVDLSQGEGAWLSEAEILRMADAVFASAPRVVFETTQGSLTVELDPDAAPVHSVALVLSVVRGDYDGTRWHRVVPSFVIQGGDPHGHGAGNAGYYLPDEITRIGYARGVLGMPKSQDDDGGCQLFFMHSPYVPLDGRYSAYGRVVDGFDALDAIRVGDRIVKARLGP